MGRSRGSEEPWRIGLLFSRTGVTAVIEESQLKGALLAVEEINAAGGVNQREVVPIVYDPASDPGMFARYAEKLLVDDKLSMIFGCYTSSSRKRVMPIVERRNGLLWYPTLYEGFEYSPNVIYTGSAPNQNGLALADFLIEFYGNRFYFVGSDYVYPHESNRIMREVLGIRGGTVVGERYLDIYSGPEKYKPIIAEIKRLHPDVIFSTVVGQGTAFLYQNYADAGLDSAVMPIASLTTSEAEVRLMGADVAEGHITAAAYFEGVRNGVNETFVANYKDRFGDDEPTNMCAEASYFQVYLFAAALAEANIMDTDVIKSLVLGREFDAPQGRISIDIENNHAQVWTRIGRLDRDGSFDIVRESLSPVKPDPYMVSI
jgi:branched-chain amino acid transport system substrate-binding protein